MPSSGIIQLSNSYSSLRTHFFWEVSLGPHPHNCLVSGMVSNGRQYLLLSIKQNQRTRDIILATSQQQELGFLNLAPKADI